MNEPSIPAPALSRWSFAPEQAEFFAHRENSVWKVTDASQVVAFRRHRPGYRTQAELASELTWMSYLHDAGLPVPRPIPDIDRNFVVTVGDACFSAIEWINAPAIGTGGEFRDGLDPVLIARRLGELIAEMHDCTDRWAPPTQFVRPKWQSRELVGPEPSWGRFWENPDLSPVESDLLLRARDRAQAELEDRKGRLDTGLIHADLLTENVLGQGQDLWLIDFDDSAIGYRTFDLATFLVRLADRPDYPKIRDALLAGYRNRRTVSSDELNLFLTVRALTYPGWIISRLDEPGGHERSKRSCRTAIKFATNYLREAS